MTTPRMRPANRFFIVAAPGHYGDKTRVLSSHSTLALARAACDSGECVRSGEKKRGEIFLRVYEDIHKIVHGVWTIPR